jgi:glycosyltransferase involved in cell wall biosynthesis
MRPEHDLKSSNMSNPKLNNQLTVVIPSKNEGFNIIKILNLLLNQSANFKVIIADSSNDENSEMLLKEYENKYSNRVKVISGGLPSVARNKGASEVKTPYVLFLDADIYLKDKYIVSKCLDISVKGDYDLVTCKFRSHDGKYKWVWVIFDIAQWISSKTKPFAVGGFMLFKTSKFNKLGGFNNEDKIAEDYHLSSKIHPRKFRVANFFIYTPSRRFKKKGVWYMIKLLILCWWNRNNESFYKKDHNYWT